MPPRPRPGYPRRACPAELSPAQLAHIERRLAACPSLRGTVLLRELREMGYSASASSLRRRLRILRPAAVGEPLIRFETGPGVHSQDHWTDCGIWPMGDGNAGLHAWVTVLGYSRMLALRFATNKARATTLSAIVRCADDLGGATAELLTDRDTALVVGSLPGGAPILRRNGSTPRRCSVPDREPVGRIGPRPRPLGRPALAWASGSGWAWQPGARCRGWNRRRS